MDKTIEVLEGSEEALVLGYHLNELDAQFELVCEFWGKSTGADRAFVRFRFFGVQQFERSPGEYERVQEVGATFLAREVEGAWVLQEVHIAKANALEIISMSLGLDFGGVSFLYEDVTYEVIHLYAVAKGTNDWDYFEVGTDKPVDFYNPFGCAWAKKGS